MIRRCLPTLLAGALGVVLWSAGTAPAHAQSPSCPDCQRFFHYPFYYFPHNYWPSQGPQWPEPPGKCYQPPPAYMAYPPYKAPAWRYELWEPQHYHRGSHFWLDQF